MGRNIAAVVASSFVVTWVVSVLLTGAWVAMGTGWGDESELTVGRAVVAAVAGLLGAWVGGRPASRYLTGSRAHFAAGSGAGLYLLLDAFMSVLAASVLLAAIVLVAGAVGTALGAVLGTRKPATGPVAGPHGR